MSAQSNIGNQSETGTVAIRTREGENLGVMPIEQALAQLSQQAQATDYAAREEALQPLRTCLTKPLPDSAHEC